MQTFIAILQVAVLAAGVFVLMRIRRDISRMRKAFAPTFEEKQRMQDRKTDVFYNPPSARDAITSAVKSQSVP